MLISLANFACELSVLARDLTSLVEQLLGHLQERGALLCSVHVTCLLGSTAALLWGAGFAHSLLGG